MPTSWAPEVSVEGKWSRNGVRFATKEEAIANARNLMMRWMLVEDARATETDDPVNYRWVDDPRMSGGTGRLASVEETQQ